MERLTPLDTAFLLLEDENAGASLAIASVAVLAGRPPSLAELTALLRDRVPMIPRLRQKVRTVPLDLLPPVWVDDPAFDIESHVQRTALPAPGDDEALCELVGDIMSTRLDRGRPLWEAWLVEGLSEHRWALVIKVHHCMADGVSGSHLYNVLCNGDDNKPVSRARTVSVPSALTRLLCTPVRIARRTVSTVRGLTSYGTSLLPIASSSLIGPTGGQRGYGIARSTLSTVRTVAHTFQVTVNDVVLSAIASGFRTLLLKRGEQPVANAVRAAVPVSIRTDGAEHVLSNQISAMLPMLPVDIEDPVQRLVVVHSRLTQLKSGQQTAAGANVTSLPRNEFFGPVAWIVRLAAHLPQRSVATVTTNVPGPRGPLRLLGREILEIFPYVPIALRMRIGVSVLTYADHLAFGVTADRGTAPDVDLLAIAIEEGISELVAAAEHAGPQS